MSDGVSEIAGAVARVTAGEAQTEVLGLVAERSDGTVCKVWVAATSDESLALAIVSALGEGGSEAALVFPEPPSQASPALRLALRGMAAQVRGAFSGDE